MRLLFLLSVLYLFMVTTYMVIAEDTLQATVKTEYTDSLEERLQNREDFEIDSGKCTVASDDKCLSIKQVKDIKSATLAAQPVYPLAPGILDTTLSICNPRKGSCF